MALYDYIIAGTGASGFGLAYHMAQSSLRGRSILLVDRDAKDQNDRTWSFWSNRPTRYDHLVYHRWDQIELISDRFHEVFDLRPYTYQMIRGIDFYQGMRESLSAVEGLTFIRGRVNAVGEAQDKKSAEVVVDKIPYGAAWAFDSTFRLNDVITGPPGYHYLKQHFKGWEVETSTDSFNPQVVTLFDFRTPQKGSMRFFYVIPFSKRRALIEYTLFSADLLKPHEYDRALSDYIENTLKITNYRITSVESGIIPMTDRPFPRQVSPHVMAIGTKGGLVKPSSGYGFLRMQQDAATIVRSLVETGSPWQVQPSPKRYRLYDTIMLQVMHRHGDMMKDIFTGLFHKNGAQTMFRFLDETAPFSENLRILTSVPIRTFMNAFFRVKLLRKV